MRRILCALLCAALLIPLLPLRAVTAEGTSPTLRVLLKRFAFTDRIDLQVDGTYAVSFGQSAVSLPRGCSAVVQVRQDQLTLSVQGMNIQCGARAVFRRYASGGALSGLRIQGGTSVYPGDLTLTVVGGQVQAVLSLAVEDYLLGVLAWEMSEDFPLEALKAQAVCARTYALSHLAPQRDWDVTDTTNDQVFRGVEEVGGRCAQAVRETAGVVGMYNGLMATCYYSASNGGRTELPGNVWGGASPAYYTVKDDPYDLENPESVVLRTRIAKTGDIPAGLQAFLWERMKPVLRENRLSEEEDCFRVNQVSELRLEGKQLVITFAFLARAVINPLEEEEELTLTGTPVPRATAQALSEWRQSSPVTLTLPVNTPLLQAMKLSIAGTESPVVRIVEEENAFLAESRRYGHGVGMSQRGAQWMASHYGASFDQILAFYYPGLTLMVGGTSVAPLPTAPEQLFATPGPSASPTPRPTLMPVSTGSLPCGSYLASVEGVADDSSLNLRAEPNAVAEILMRLYKHQLLIVLSVCDDPAWVHVKTDSAEGYVKAEFLERVE